MKKIPTLFVRDSDNPRHLTDEVHPDCLWVFAGGGRATRKYDGTCVMFDGSQWWARREVKPGKETPPDFVGLGTDENTGKTMGWEPAGQSSFAKVLTEAVEHGDAVYHVGTYELCGPKVNRNPEGYDSHVLVPHSKAERYPALDNPLGKDELEKALTAMHWEGIVWHHPDGRMAKLKRRDFA